MQHLTLAEAEQLAEKVPTKNEGSVPSLLTLHTTEAMASKERAESEKSVADPLDDEAFNKLIHGIEDKK